MTNMLKYEVQRLDGSSESVTRAIDLILGAFEQSGEITLSVYEEFFNEYMKTTINRM